MDVKTPKETVNKVIEMEEPIAKAQKVIDKVMQDKSALRLYIARKMAIMDFNTSMRGAEEKGEKRGIKIGEEKGILSIAKRLKTEGFSSAEIKKFTKLPLEEIERL